MIFGERVRLRRVEREDLPRFVQWLNDAEVREHLAAVYPMSHVHEEQWFADTLKLEPALQPFAIDVRAAEAWIHVGGTALHNVDWRNRSAELGIFLGDKSIWGAGYGTDALRTFVAWAFRELNLNRVWLKVYEDNARGIRCYEKVGFRREGRLRQDRFHSGRYQDTLLMGLLREESGSG